MVENIKQQSNLTSGIFNNSPSVSQGQEVEREEKSSIKAVQEEVKKLQETKDVQDLKKDLMELTEQLNKEFNPLNTNIKFGYSDDIESLYVTVSERNTNRLIRKIPSDEAMELMAKMREIVGIIFDKKG